jgi:lysophospholipase L1-like esterase
MKNLLCYGDSNTWGQIPLRDFVKTRYPRDVRWTGRLQQLGSQRIHVIEEGNNGRTTGVEDPLRIGRNGFTYLSACLDSAVPLDLVILMLGTNDLKAKFQPTPETITERLKELVKITKTICSAPPNIHTEILIIAPPIIQPQYYIHGDFNYECAEEYSKKLAAHYEDLCKQENIHFMNSAAHVKTSMQDGVHLDDQQHKLLADAVWIQVKRILNMGH